MTLSSERDLIEFRRDGAPPDFSICVPQYNRTSFLLKAVESYSRQTHRSFEICISDGASPDGRQTELVDTLLATGIPFAFYRSPVNLRYDANLRSAIALARGNYCVLMGNDDAFANPDTLAQLWADIRTHHGPGVVLSDYCDYQSGRRAYAIRATKNYGGGPRVAAFHFRNYSFVSGIAIDRDAAQSLATDKWDGSEMYQMYIGSRIVAAGRDLLERNVPAVRKDIPAPGEQVDSYARRPRVWPCPIVERPLPLGQIGRLVADAIAPYAGPDERRWNEAVLDQLLGITYPFWLTEYRKVQSWRYAAGVAIGMRPVRTAAGVPLGMLGRARVWMIYWAATVAGLIVPQSVFTRIKGRLHWLVKTPR
ncbi:MAG TPA: glycosyltransferase family 2 protein [Pirellulales bacterium]|nr:glycosyltransferase family 2 protein [Pirellulales bacterium]